MKSIKETICESLIGSYYEFDKIEETVLSNITRSSLFQNTIKRFGQDDVLTSGKMGKNLPSETYCLAVSDRNKNPDFYDVFFIDGKTRYSISGDSTRASDGLLVGRGFISLRAYEITKEEAHEFYELWKKEMIEETKNKIEVVGKYF